MRFLLKEVCAVAVICTLLVYISLSQILVVAGNPVELDPPSPAHLQILPIEEGLNITAACSSIEAGAGHAATYSITVANVGEMSENVTLSAAVPAGWSVSFLAANGETIKLMYLGAGESRQLAVKIVSPLDAGAAEVSFTINATSSNGTATASLSLIAIFG